MQPSNNTPIKIIAGIVVLALAGLGIWQLNKPDATVVDQTANGEMPATTTPTNDAMPPASATKYKDGTYSATGNYNSPAGGEEVFVTLVIKDNTIVDATFVGKATNPGSKQMQGQFASGFKTFVVGKPVDSIALTVVNGSSLTPKGFMDALSKIKVQAQA